MNVDECKKRGRNKEGRKEERKGTLIWPNEIL